MKTLFVGLWYAQEPQTGMRKALREASESYKELCWPQHRDNVALLNARIIAEAKDCDVVFMQIQTPGIIAPDTVKLLNDEGRKVFNFTGDVRQPLPQWYYDLAPYVHTLFSDGKSAIEVKAKGFQAEFFPMAYDPELYCEKGRKQTFAEVVFMGNHYPGAFPLSQSRFEIVSRLQKEKDFRFASFGSGYPKSINLNFQQLKEAEVYRGAKIGISISHFAIHRYYSDRLLRIMGCGAMAISHYYDGIGDDFSIGKHLDVFTKYDDLKDMIMYYLDNEDHRKEIAIAGNEYVKQRHTWAQRFEDLKTILKREKVC